MRKVNQILVLPRKAVLSDAGTLWESRLFLAGWNELPAAKKVGCVRRMFRLSDTAAVVAEIEFAGCGVVVDGVFGDEVTRV